MTFSFEMRLADGTPAEPPRFTSAVPNWNVGDVAMIRPGVKYRIVETEYDQPAETTTWIVEPVQNMQ
jgi:hypothetical protein